jgi:glycogen operon protein
MVRELHAAGLEVILDIVLEHAAESCVGSTLDVNHPAIRQLILSVLRYWVAEMHVDGFRLDLSAVLGAIAPGACFPTCRSSSRLQRIRSYAM